MKNNICKSIRNLDEEHLQCQMFALKNNEFCPLHLSLTYKKKYNEKILFIHNKNIIKKKFTINSLIANTNFNTNKTVQNEETVMHEQKKSTIENEFTENEDNLEIKLLIIANEKKYIDKLSKLIGPVFDDVTLSEDDQDPITYDSIWKYENGKKVAASINKFYLFSYIDIHDKIRCMTIFTINDMIKNKDYKHPLTFENIPEKDILRATKLINFYKTRIGLFKETDVNTSQEYSIKSRITNLFKKFHIHSIFFEEKWLLDIEKIQDLYTIIKETNKLIKANLQIIGITDTNVSLFNSIKNETNNILDVKEYIIDQWEKFINLVNNPENQMPIWIIFAGLATVKSEIKDKYPNFELIN